jgi:hypothetical protein
MSYTTLHGFDKNGDIYDIKDYKNAHIYSMLIWVKFGEKYGILNPAMMLVNDDIAKAIWGLAKDEKVPEYDQITMKTTFDRALVYKKDFPKLVAAMRESAKWLPSHCHITEMANDIEVLQTDEKVEAIGWNGTSVVRVWDSGEDGDYNLNKHKGHFDMFETSSIEVIDG